MFKQFLLVQYFLITSEFDARMCKKIRIEKKQRSGLKFPFFPTSFRCTRLNLISLAYLWRREQAELLQEMIDCRLEAIIIKVASLGLTPDRHLGKSIKDMQGHLVKMHEKYGVNICGEGGEYETFTLDCPLFKKRIVM